LDFSRLEEIAEQLSANKGMFRADFFVGRPSTPPSRRSGMEEDKVHDLRVAVSESEVFAPMAFTSDRLPADAARLWSGGDKKRNYEIISNT
jgi:hypothetical protein